MNITSCHEFSKNPLPTFILTLHKERVSYYLFKGCVIVETEQGSLDNAPIRVQRQLNTVYLNEKDSLLTRKTTIPLIVKTLNKIIIPIDVYDTYFSNYNSECHIECFNL